MSGLPIRSLLMNACTTMEVFVEVRFRRVPWPILQTLAAAGLRKTLEKKADSGKVNAREERGFVASL